MTVPARCGPDPSAPPARTNALHDGLHPSPPHRGRRRRRRVRPHSGVPALQDAPRHPLRGRRAVGGHAHTHDVPLGDGSTAPVDSGFIVLNDRTYPLLRRLFAELDVRTRPTEMSMSISCAECGLNYVGGRRAAGIFAQRRRVLDPTFWRMLLAIRRFQKAALRLLDDEAENALTYGEFLDLHGFDRHFVSHYALPIVSCVWSMGRPRGARLPRGVPVRVPAPPRLPGARRRPDLAHRGRRLPGVRRSDHQPAGRRPHQHPRDGGQPQARRGGARRRAGRAPRVRQGRDRHPRRRCAGPAHRRRRGRPPCWAPSATPPTSRTCTATRPSARAARESSWNYWLGAATRPPAAPRCPTG